MTDVHTLAEKLDAATRSGILADAYRVLREIPLPRLADVALRAGYSIPAGAKPRDLLADISQQVAEACRNCTDGRGLIRAHKAR